MRVALCGTGLIGGSVGLALAAVAEVDEIVAYDAAPGRSEDAVARGVAQRAAASPEGAGEGADLIVVATPVAAIADVACLAALGAKPGAIVTDVGSVKAKVVADVSRRMTPRARFVGGHPMAGSEQDGLAAASATLFKGATWVLTPSEGTDPDALVTLERVVTAMGAHPVRVDPHKHDRVVAVVSHLPHLAAGALLNLAAARSLDEEGLLALSAGGFRDMTRVSSGAPGIWLDICEDNADAIIDVIDSYTEVLAQLRSAIAHENRGEVLRMLETARDARALIPAKHGAAPRHLAEIVLPVPDRPGALAEVFAVLADVNVEDFQITHSAEGGRGLLHLVFAAGVVAERAQGALELAGFETRVHDLR